MVRCKIILFITIIWLAVLLSGCVGDKNITETAKITPEIAATTTPLMTPLPENTSTGNMAKVKLDGIIGFIPENQTIKVGGEVVWENFDPVAVILISNDGFFDEKLLAFYQNYRYVFSNPGTYTFTLKNTNLTGTIIVESRVITAPSVTIPEELPYAPLYVTARMLRLSDWTSASETKYGLNAFKVKVLNQMNIPLTIKAQILSGDQILEERTFTLEKLDSGVEFSNEQKHFIYSSTVILRLLIQGYAPIEYEFIEVDRLD